MQPGARGALPAVGARTWSSGTPGKSPKQGASGGVTANSEPPTEVFSADHCAGVGQQAWPGAHHGAARGARGGRARERDETGSGRSGGAERIKPE